MKTNEEAAMLITFPLLVSTPLGGFLRMTRQCRNINASLRERRRRLKRASQTFPSDCYFFWCDRYFGSGGLSILGGVTMSVLSLLVTLNFLSGK